MNYYDKSLISLRYWLQGANMHLALKALEFAAKFHVGLRKDGKTKEFYHQISIIRYLRTLYNHMDFPQETLAVAALHDVAEDYDVGFEEIEILFGHQICEAVKVLTKKHRGNKLSNDIYYSNIAENAIASIVKGADRINNIQTMMGVFTYEKQNKYIVETTELVFPMLKKARRKFTTQEPVYENEKLMLQTQLSLLQEIHRVGQKITVPEVHGC